jgi:hypothetical protein
MHSSPAWHGHRRADGVGLTAGPAGGLALGVLESGAPSDGVLSLTVGPRASSPFDPRAVLSPVLGPRVMRSGPCTGSPAQASTDALSTTTATWRGGMGDATFCSRPIRHARTGRPIASSPPTAPTSRSRRRSPRSRENRARPGGQQLGLRQVSQHVRAGDVRRRREGGQGPLTRSSWLHDTGLRLDRAPEISLTVLWIARR